MRLTGPLSINVIRLFRGIADLYYWKGIPVARKWPRPPQQPDSTEQLTARANFTTVMRFTRTQSAQFLSLWSDLHPPRRRSWADVFRKYCLWLLAKHWWREPPAVISVQRIQLPESTTTTIWIYCAPFTAPADAPKTHWYFRPVENDKPSFTYFTYARKRSREHHIIDQIAVNTNDFRRPSSQKFIPSENAYKLTVPSTPLPIALIAKPEEAPHAP